MKNSISKFLTSLVILLSTLQVSAQLDPPLVQNTQEVCSTATIADLTATADNGNTIRWYSSSTGGTPLQLSSIINEGTFYASQVQSSGNNTIATIAGSGFGNSNGTGTGASFIGASDLVFDSNGNLFVLDTDDNRIRKITPSGVVSYFAGSGNQNPGFANGTGITAKFNQPKCIAIDNNDNLYVTDYSNNRIRKIDTNGYVTTFAGSGDWGEANGTALEAEFKGPTGIAIDSNGNMFVSVYNNKIRKIDTNGNVTDFAGSTAGYQDGTGANAKFNGLSYMTIDKNNNLYVSEEYNDKIRKITNTGIVTTVAGGSDGFANGNGSNAKFSNPKGLVVDSNNIIYVADAGNNRIRKITPNGDVTTFAGTQAPGGATNGSLSNATFNQANGITFDTYGNLYITDYNNYKIRKITIPSEESDRVAVAVTFSNPTITGNSTLTTGATTTLTGSGTAAATSPWTSSNTGVATVSNNGTVTGISIGETTIKYTNNVGCEVTQSITVNLGPPSASANQEVCPNATFADLTATADNGNTIRWYNSSTGGTPLGVLNTLQNTTYYASQYGTTTDPFSTTIAGDGTEGSTNGVNATFYRPSGLAMDSNGAIYVADEGNHLIRKIDVNGETTTFAGSGTQGFQDGTGDTAKFNTPKAIAIDAQDNVYVVDGNNGAIRKITPAGYVTTFAGTGTFGDTDGAGNVAQFFLPNDIAFDTLGNLFVVEGGPNQKIRKITPAGIVSTYAGNGIGNLDGSLATAKFSNPTAITIDQSNVIYVADYTTGNIRKITPNGIVSTIAGTGIGGFANGIGSVAQFKNPTGIAVDYDGNVYVSDTENYRIRKINTNGDVSTFAGNYNGGLANGTLTETYFKKQAGIVIDNNGNLLIADKLNHAIRKISIPSEESDRVAVAVTFSNPTITGNSTLTTGETVTLTGSGTAAATNPWTSSNTAIATVSNNGTVTGINTGSCIITYTNNLGCTVTQSITVTHITPLAVSSQTFCLDTTIADLNATPTTNNTLNWYADEAATNSIETTTELTETTYYVNQTQAARIESFAGSTSGTSNGTGSTAQFNKPFGMDFDANGNLFIADRSNHAIRKITPNGVVTTFAGSAGNSGSNDGTGTNAKFNNPTDVAFDADGNLYVSDEQNHSIRKITPNGVVTTIAGTGNSGSTNANGTSASFNRPYGIAVDSNGNVFVSDTYNHLIRKITPNGTVTTFAGNGDDAFADGTGTNASFYRPYDIDVDAQNNLYVADRYNHRVRKISPQGVVTTIAGNGIQTLTNGNGTTAAFDDLQGVAVDAQGNVFVADEQNLAVRKIAPNGDVTTYAGTGVKGSSFGVATDALLSQPRYLAVDQNGYVYLADTDVHLIKKITPQLESPTVAIAVTIDNPTISGPSTVERNSTITLTATGTPAATNPWTSSDTTIATVSNNGVVTGLEYGTVTVTYTTSNGCTETKSINMFLNPPIVETNQEVCPGSTVSDLVASPTNGTDIVWYSDPDGLNALNETEILSEGTYYVKQTKTAQIEHLIGNTPQNPNTISTIQAIKKINDNEYLINDGESIKKLYLNTNYLTTLFTSNLIFGIGLDAINNIYHINFYNHFIVKINVDGNNGYGNVDTLSSIFDLSYSSQNLVVSPNGIIYVTDTNGHKIYKRELNGEWSIHAGSTLGSNDSNIGATARFNTPKGIDMDSYGNLFVADMNNDKIRKIEINGATSTFAVINNPETLTIDNHNNIFTSNGSKIYKITPQGDVSTVVASNGSTEGVFNLPNSLAALAVAAHSSGDLIIGNYNGVSKIIYRNSESEIIPVNVTLSNPTILGESVNLGETTTLNSTNNEPAAINPWVSSDESIATITETGLLSGLNPGIVEITYNSEGGCSVTKVINVNMSLPSIDTNQILCEGSTLNNINNNNGENLNWYSENSEPISNNASINEGTFYVTNSIHTNVTTLAGSSSGYIDGDISIAKFSSPSKIAIDSANNLYIADGNLIRKIDTNDNVTTLAGNINSGFQDGVGLSARFNYLSDIKIYNNELYVTDFSNNCIRKILLDGTVSTIAGTGEAGLLDGPAISAKFKNPSHLTILENGIIYISDYSNHRIRKLDLSGNVSTFAGGSYGYANGIGTDAMFKSPSGITHDSAGNLFIADQGNNRIRKITPEGVVSTYAGTGSAGTTNGNITFATFDSPTNITIDNSENIFITTVSFYDYSIRKISSDGVVSTFAGNSTKGFIDGSLLDSKFRDPRGITITNNNDLLICDTGNKKIRKITNIQSALVTINITFESPEINGVSTVFINDSATLTATGTPAATNPWTSSDESIATVSNTGEVTGVSTGSVIITYNTSGDCTATKTIEVKVPVVWDGTVWSNTTGPTATLDALIDGDLTITEDLIANSLLINADKTLIINPTKKLQVMGDLTNKGTIIFKSDATGDGYFDQYNGAEISGTGIVKTERYVPAKRAFRFLASSLTTSTSIKENWQENAGTDANLGTHITGTGGATNGFDVTENNNPSLFTFNNNTVNWQAVENTNVNILTAGNPYRIMVRGDRTISMATNTPTPTPTVLRANGNLYTGDYSLTGEALNQNAEGYSLIGNPYQAPVNLGSALSASTNMSTDFIYFWDPAISGTNGRGGFVTYDLDTESNNVNGSGITKYLQPGQAAFIQKNNTTDAASFIIKEANKSVENGNAAVFRTTSGPSSIRLTLREPNTNAPIDGTVAVFNSNYSTDATSEDAIKFSNLEEQVSIRKGATLLSINKQPEAQENTVLQLDIKNYRSTQYNWQLETINYNGLQPVLYDAYLDSYTPFSDSNYSFSVNNEDTESTSQNRFSVVFDANLSNELFVSSNVAVYPNPTKNAANGFYVSYFKPETLSVTLHNSLGQLIGTKQQIENGQIKVVPNTILEKGVYLIAIKTDNKTVNKKWIIN